MLLVQGLFLHTPFSVQKQYPLKKSPNFIIEQMCIKTLGLQSARPDTCLSLCSALFYKVDVEAFLVFSLLNFCFIIKPVRK